jgi:hypothetical protein
MMKNEAQLDYLHCFTYKKGSASGGSVYFYASLRVRLCRFMDINYLLLAYERTKKSLAKLTKRHLI